MYSFLGLSNNFSFVIGWLPKKAVLSVDTITHEYRMNFTIQTYDIDNKLRLIDCVCDGAVAKAFADQHQKNDIAIVLGQWHHTYSPSRGSKINRFKVLDFTIPVAFKTNKNLPELDTETQEMMNDVMNKAFNYWSQSHSVPTDEEIKFWVDYWNEYRELRNLPERKPEKKKKKEK